MPPEAPPSETTGRRGQARKLGIADQTSVLLIDAPPDWELVDPPDDCPVHRRRSSSLAAAPREAPRVVLCFVKNEAALARLTARLAPVAEALAPIWICWPRRAGGHESDLGDERVRAAGLSFGLVDNKVAAVDDDWSGLRFARRRS